MGIASARAVPESWRWFSESRFGLFIHWGPYALYGRGEQVMFREHVDPNEYIARACEWNPKRYDPGAWAEIAKKAGMKYACLTARHHDGYCLWDTRYTDYSSAKQAPKRDFVREYVDAFRSAGLKIGLYYSWLDWRLPAYFDGPHEDPKGFEKVREYLHNQVEELLTNYGQIDYFFFDGAWPRDADDLQSVDLVRRMRSLHPNIMVNDRLGAPKNRDADSDDSSATATGAEHLGDFNTPEHHIKADPNRMWESNQVATWRLWGHAIGERWRPADVLLDMLCECAEKGGNLLLNVGPTADGEFPPQFVERALAIGQWLDVHGEAIYGSEGGDVTEFVTRGRQTVKGDNLYLIFRFWDGRSEMRLADLVTPVERVVLLTTGQELEFVQKGDELVIQGLPKERPTALFPVIRLECKGRPQANQWGRERLWGGDPSRVAAWARTRGTSVFADGKERE
jgi:alpha-L-fucosidase